MLKLNSPLAGFDRLSVAVLATLLVVAFSTGALAQNTLSTGSIVGTVSDPTGAVVNGAKVVVTNTKNGQTLNLTSNSSGLFSSGSLDPGVYKVHVAAKGFSTISGTITVQVDNTATFNAKLQVGQEAQVIEVLASSVQVNTEQAAVQGVLTSEQIENLPVNGRNFLDLAQLEPGVQIQDGQNFDPTKAGYSSISFGGRFGRTARVSVDGIDISDETVGTTTADVPASAIDEFQVSQSSLDLSQDLTSSGAVNVTTKTGTNAVHGEAFGFIRDHSFAAAAPGGHDYPFQREQFGGKVGGPIIKNRMFFFLDGERTKQDSFAAVSLAGTPYNGFSGGFGQPFRESNLLARADYTFHNGARAFYKYSYFANSLFATFGFGYSVYDNKDYTRDHVLGLDFNTGSFSHSIRFSYLKFQNQIVDVTTGNKSLPLSSTGLEFRSGNFWAGPNLLAPQSTPQANRQLKYDGTKIWGAHTLRFGVSLNHIQGGGFANFYGTAPRVSWTTSPNFGACTTGTIAAPCAGSTEAFANAGPFPNGDLNPLNYQLNTLRVGNGQGFNTLNPALGFPAGGLGPDNRIGLYVGDSWKLRRNFTVNLGLRYDRDTGRTDSDLPADAAINAQFPGAGNPVKQANKNFAPQIGLAWDPQGNGKTAIRAGVGLYYENVIFNNVLFDRPLRLQTGAFNAVTAACAGNLPQQVPVNTGTIAPVGICGQVIGNVIPQILSFWNQVKAGNPLDLKAPNPNYIGNLLAAGLGAGPALFAPNYQSPRSVQMNIGFQHEFRPGLVFSADYLRNIGTHSLLGIDINHVGDIKNFNLSAAQAAITATEAAFGCANVDCVITAGGSMVDFATHGLTADTDFGQACNQALGVACAFGGKNPNQTAFSLLEPIGRSAYNALQMKLVDNVKNPFRGVKSLNFQAAYSLSSFKNTGGAQLTGQPADNDQDFVLASADNNNPGRYFGPAILDRTHQLSVGGFFDVVGGFRVGLITHFDSPLSTSIVVPNTGNPGEIFRTDFTGDGTVQDPLPGTHIGQFDRGTNAAGLTSLISNYNTKFGNQATPAGQVLITQGLFTLAQLQGLGGVAPTVAAPPAGQQDFGWLRALDLKLSWHHTFKERFTVEPSVGLYNLPNFSNFNLPPTTMNGLLNGAGSGAINGTTKADREAFRVGNGTGVYSLGSARQIEFGLRLTF